MDAKPSDSNEPRQEAEPNDAAGLLDDGRPTEPELSALEEEALPPPIVVEAGPPGEPSVAAGGGLGRRSDRRRSPYDDDAGTDDAVDLPLDPSAGALPGEHAAAPA